MKLQMIGVLALAASCAHDPTTARAVSSKPGKGGVVTLNPHEDPRARAKADEIMARTCSGKKAEITEEGEAVVGSTKKSNTEHNSGNSGGLKIAGFGLPSSSSETDTTERQLTEWRITYECK